MPIYWEQFDWQSFATLTAGAMAVAGAVVVGLRQMRISEKQNEILSRQVQLAELTVRHEIFDRRYEVYEAARAFLGHIIAHANEPGPKLRNGFLGAMNDAKLLFRPAVHEGLQVIWERVGEFIVLRAEMDSLYRKEGSYGLGNPAKEKDLLTAIFADWEGLIDLFGDEMRLGDEP